MHLQGYLRVSTVVGCVSRWGLAAKLQSVEFIVDGFRRRGLNALICSIGLLKIVLVESEVSLLVFQLGSRSSVAFSSGICKVEFCQ